MTDIESYLRLFTRSARTLNAPLPILFRDRFAARNGRKHPVLAAVTGRTWRNHVGSFSCLGRGGDFRRSDLEVAAINNPEQGIPQSALYYLAVLADFYRSALNDGEPVGLLETAQLPSDARTAAEKSPCGAVFEQHAIDDEDLVNYDDDLEVRDMLLTHEIRPLAGEHGFARARVSVRAITPGLCAHLQKGSMIETLYGVA